MTIRSSHIGMVASAAGVAAIGLLSAGTVISAPAALAGPPSVSIIVPTVIHFDSQNNHGNFGMINVECKGSTPYAVMSKTGGSVRYELSDGSKLRVPEGISNRSDSHINGAILLDSHSNNVSVTVYCASSKEAAKQIS